MRRSTSRIIYVFGVIDVAVDEEMTESDYDFFTFGGDKSDTRIGAQTRYGAPEAR
jgi:hypothetical protein